MSKKTFNKKIRVDYNKLSNEELFIKLLSRYKKRFDRDIAPELEKRSYYVSPSEKRRKKHIRAIARLKKTEVKSKSVEKKVQSLDEFEKNYKQR